MPLTRNENESSLDKSNNVLKTKSISFGRPLVNEFSIRSRFTIDERVDVGNKSLKYFCI